MSEELIALIRGVVVFIVCAVLFIPAWALAFVFGRWCAKLLGWY